LVEQMLPRVVSGGGVAELGEDVAGSTGAAAINRASYLKAIPPTALEPSRS
jgi:hypothetical protein